jgi:hypothetical protein
MFRLLGYYYFSRPWRKIEMGFLTSLVSERKEDGADRNACRWMCSKYFALSCLNDFVYLVLSFPRSRRRPLSRH